jgi:hypothetical protein
MDGAHPTHRVMAADGGPEMRLCLARQRATMAATCLRVDSPKIVIGWAGGNMFHEARLKGNTRFS